MYLGLGIHRLCLRRCSYGCTRARACVYFCLCVRRSTGLPGLTDIQAWCPTKFSVSLLLTPFPCLHLIGPSSLPCSGTRFSVCMYVCAHMTLCVQSNVTYPNAGYLSTSYIQRWGVINHVDSLTHKTDCRTIARRAT